MEEQYAKSNMLRFKGLLPAVSLILFGAVLMLASNLFLTDKTNTAIENAQIQAQTVQESPLCQGETQNEDACIQSEKILKNATSSIPGPQGNQGVQGPQGLPGVAGVPGSKGDKGDAGPKGDQGFLGNQGSIGLQGLQGFQGLKGESIVGPQGPQGPAGLNGLDGAPGKDGAPGPAGADGKDGAPGPAGADGTNGVDGASPTGIMIDCSSGMVTVTLSNGSVITGSANCDYPALPVPVPEAAP